MIASAFLLIIKREFYLAFRAKQAFINPLIFFVIVTSLFPLAISPDTKILQLLAPGVIWIAALLATLLSLDKLFKTDFDDGSLEQMILSGFPLTILTLAKVGSYWLLTSLPLIIISPVIALMFHLPMKGIIAMILSLLLGTPILCLLGAIGSALTVGLRNSAILLTLLILPLYIPILIFGSSIISTALIGLTYNGQLALLGALLALALSLCPLAIAGSLRICVNY